MKREIEFRPWRKEEYKTKRKGKGYYKTSGYILQYAPFHPHCSSRGYVPEHRLIIENKLGRYLTPRKELVHHLNGIRDDNRIENLSLSNPKDHAIGHIGERNKHGQFVCASKEFEDIQFRLYDIDRGLTQIYKLSELISKTYRRGKFEFQGRFTGLKDKNGVKIFEGDIVKGVCINGSISHCQVVYNHGCFYFRQIGAESLIDMIDNQHSQSEVIGNTHEEVDP